MPQTIAGQREYEPLLAHRCSLEFGKEVTGLIISCNGLASENKISAASTTSPGGKDIPDSRTPGNLTLTPLDVKLFVLKGDTFFEDWFKAIQDGKVKANTKDGSIKVYDSEGKAVAQWDFTSAWPSKIAYSELSADSDEALSATVTLVYEGFRRVKV